MAQHARTAILTTFKQALSGLGTQPQVFTQAAVPIPVDNLPALTIAPGEETVDGSDHGAGFPTLRTLRINVTCSAITQELADEMASEVEVAAPYGTAGLGAFYAGSAFAASGDGERFVFQTQLHFDVRYEVSVS